MPDGIVRHGAMGQLHGDVGAGLPRGLDAVAEPQVGSTPTPDPAAPRGPTRLRRPVCTGHSADTLDTACDAHHHRGPGTCPTTPGPGLGWVHVRERRTTERLGH